MQTWVFTRCLPPTDTEFLYRSAENSLNIYHVDTQTSEEILSQEAMVGHGAGLVIRADGVGLELDIMGHGAGQDIVKGLGQGGM